MRNSDVLRLLLPLEIGGVMIDDLNQEGLALDAAEASADRLLNEMFPFLAAESFPDWERVLAITSRSTDPLQLRRDRVVARLRSRGSLTKAYYEGLATAMGITVTIHENIGGDPFKWGVEVPGDVTYFFYAGASCAGEYLADYADVVSEVGNLFLDLKPAHTQCVLPYTP